MELEKRISWMDFFKEILATIEKRSLCSIHVAAMLVASESKNILSYGYNGTIPGTANPEYNNGNHTVGLEIHAEVNCLAKANNLLGEECELWVSYKPCMRCAHAIVASKKRLNITKVFYLKEFLNSEDKYASLDSAKFLDDAGIITIKV
jgi:deoxycytidylate deaminase